MRDQLKEETYELLDAYQGTEFPDADASLRWVPIALKLAVMNSDEEEGQC